MNNDLISRAALLKKKISVPIYDRDILGGYRDCEVVRVDDVTSAPAIDIADFVCKHYESGRCNNYYGLYGRPKKDDFCSYGEVKNGTEIKS